MQCTSEHSHHIDNTSLQDHHATTVTWIEKLQYIDKFVLCYNLTIPRPGSTMEARYREEQIDTILLHGSSSVGHEFTAKKLRYQNVKKGTV